MSNLSSGYQSWLDNQNILAKKALELIRKYGFKVVIVEQISKPNFVRVNLGNNRIDFFIKSIKNRFVKFVWLCKQGDFNIKNNYFVYLEKEEKFLISTGGEIDRKSELRDSEYHKGVKYIVVPIDAFRSANSFLKTTKKRYDAMLQRRMSEFIPKSI